MILIVSISAVEKLVTDYSDLLPTKDDLRGAALALVRLTDTYRLNMSDIARGRILDLPTKVHLTSEYFTVTLTRRSNDQSNVIKSNKMINFVFESSVKTKPNSLTIKLSIRSRLFVSGQTLIQQRLLWSSLGLVWRGLAKGPSGRKQNGPSWGDYTFLQHGDSNCKLINQFSHSDRLT